METNQIMAAVNQITVNKGEHQLIEWKSPVSGDTGNLAIALSGRKINNSTVEELKQVLRLVFVKVGLRANNFPNGEEKEVLISHIVHHYGNHTPLELRLAFEMAITFKLDLVDKDIPCYENFSCAYVSKVMNSYRRWAAEEREHLVNNLELPDQKELPPIEMLDWINEWQKRDNIIVDLIPMAFYDFLTDTGELVVSKEDKFASIERAAKAIKTELHDDVPSCKTMDALRAVNEFKAMEEKGFTGKFRERILNKAKKLIVYDYLTKK